MRKYSCSGPTVVRTRLTEGIAENVQNLDGFNTDGVHGAEEGRFLVKHFAAV